MSKKESGGIAELAGQPMEKQFFKSENDSVMSLWELIQRLQNDDLIFAPHQREFIWTNDRIQGRVNTLINSRGTTARPTGFMATYQLPGQDITYLNDGLQRLMTTVLFLKNPLVYGISQKEAERIVRNFDMPVQHRNYLSHEKGMIAFQLMNYGSTLTNYEFCNGFLRDLESSTTNWQPFIADLREFMKETVEPVTGYLKKKVNRDLQHLFNRHDYLLFYLFSSQQRLLSAGYESLNKKNVNLITANKGIYIEQVLRRELESKGIDEILTRFDTYKRFITEQKTLLIEAWDSFSGAFGGKNMSPQIFRYFLTIAVWVRNNGINMEAFKTFVYKTLPHTNGGTATIFSLNADGLVIRESLSIGSFSHFKRQCEYVGSDLYDLVFKTKVETKKTNPARQRPRQRPRPRLV